MKRNGTARGSGGCKFIRCLLFFTPIFSLFSWPLCCPSPPFFLRRVCGISRLVEPFVNLGLVRKAREVKERNIVCCATKKEEERSGSCLFVVVVCFQRNDTTSGFPLPVSPRSARSARISPITEQNLNPWPEKPPATTTCPPPKQFVAPQAAKRVSNNGSGRAQARKEGRKVPGRQQIRVPLSRESSRSTTKWSSGLLVNMQAW